MDTGLRNQNPVQLFSKLGRYWSPNNWARPLRRTQKWASNFRSTPNPIKPLLIHQRKLEVSAAAAALSLSLGWGLGSGSGAAERKREAWRCFTSSTARFWRSVLTPSTTLRRLCKSSFLFSSFYSSSDPPWREGVIHLPYLSVEIETLSDEFFFVLFFNLMWRF